MPCLFKYAAKELDYSEGAAYRRIKAIKLCRDLPDTKSRIQSGKLSLSSACQLQAYFEKQAKKAKVKKHRQEIKSSNQTEEQKQKMETQKSFLETSQNNFTTSSPQEFSNTTSIKKVEGCSIRATMKLLSEADPSLSIPKEQIRFLGKGKVEIKFVIDEDCHKKLEELKSLLSHKHLLRYIKIKTGVVH